MKLANQWVVIIRRSLHLRRGVIVWNVVIWMRGLGRRRHVLVGGERGSSASSLHLLESGSDRGVELRRSEARWRQTSNPWVLKRRLHK